MQNNPYPLQPPDPSGHPSYPVGQPSPSAQQPSPFYGANPQQQQPYPPQQQPYYSPQPHYLPQPQQANPNQTYVVVNTSQKVNTGCAPWIIWVGVGVALLLCVIFAAPALLAMIAATRVTHMTGSTGASTNGISSGSQHHKVGDVVTVTGENGMTYTMTVSAAQFMKNSNTGKTYLIVDLQANNTGNSTINIYSLDFKLIDATGQMGLPHDMMIPPGRHLFSGQAPPNGTISGSLSFEVQPDQHDFIMNYTYAPSLSASAVYGWDLHTS